MSDSEKCCLPNEEAYDVYDDLERLQRQVVLLKQENCEQAEKIARTEQQRLDLLQRVAKLSISYIQQRRVVQGQADTIGGYQQSSINLTFQIERLEEQVDRLKKRSLWQRIRNIDPTV